MLHAIKDEAALRQWLADERLSTFVLGPGFGAGERARRFVHALSDRRLVLDADGITSFRDDPQALFDAFSDGPTRLVLTPHEGEFARLFPDIAGDEAISKVDKAKAAAERSHAAIIYKGPDSVIAAPDGHALINANAPPWLATAGSGDVLAGIVGGLLAQGRRRRLATRRGRQKRGQGPDGRSSTGAYQPSLRQRSSRSALLAYLILQSDCAVRCIDLALVDHEGKHIARLGIYLPSAIDQR
jgi:hydroxyethylthiazole kinase-like uncharacterized protein yjeF